MDCVSCSASLDDRPCILVYSEPYCFKCAKHEIKDLEQATLQKYEKDLKDYETRVLAFQKQHPAFRSDMGWAGYTPGVLLAFFGTLFCPYVGTIIGFFIGYGVHKYFWDKANAKLEATFESRNPYPVKHDLELDDILELDDTHFAESIAGTNYRRRILMRDDYTCQNCEEQKSEEDLEVHHIQIRANGGTDHPTNLVTLCKHCHDRERWFGHKRMFPTTFRRG
jgi:hypothetical protein